MVTRLLPHVCASGEHLGGTDNYPVDRIAGDEYMRISPSVVEVARTSRGFLIRSIRFLAGEAGQRQAQDQYNETGAIPYTLRSPEEIAGFFDSLELVEPGVVSCPLWRPDRNRLEAAEELDAFGGVGRKA